METKHSYLKVRFDLGLYGEYLTYKNLKYFEKGGAKFLFNCYVPTQAGGTTEIDLLLIEDSGIYVFESKNYSGWIFGKENSRMWTQTLPQGKGKRAHKEQFLNPIMQNKLHIKCLQEFLEVDVPIYSVIIFSDRCTFKDLSISSATVIHRSDVNTTVRKIAEQNKDKLMPDVVNSFYNQLYPRTQVTTQMKQDHIAAIHKKRSEGSNILTPQVMDESCLSVRAECDCDSITTEAGLANGEGQAAMPGAPGVHVCPQCKGNLILRTAKKGVNEGKQFYGCSNFPRCRYIENLPEGKCNTSD